MGSPLGQQTALMKNGDWRIEECRRMQKNAEEWGHPLAGLKSRLKANPSLQNKSVPFFVAYIASQ